jgi:hypothetical protein
MFNPRQKLVDSHVELILSQIKITSVIAYGAAKLSALAHDSFRQSKVISS